ncbi:MAG: hypothetical protein JEZ08_16535 [Clostridiales bacterium]|nr:hypothetical protein [Clostridiales bacterium]
MKGKVNIYYECVINPKSVNKLRQIPNLNTLLLNSIEVLNQELTIRKKQKGNGIKEAQYTQAASIVSIVYVNDSVVIVFESDGDLSPKQMIRRIKVKLWDIFREKYDITKANTFWLRADDIKSMEYKSECDTTKNI